MKFKLSYATGAAALLLMLEAIYAFLVTPELNTHQDNLQTALLFIVLGACYEIIDEKYKGEPVKEKCGNKQQE